MLERCTCQPGRDHDGSEFGPCEFCERQADAERAQQALQRDAARWRISHISRPPQGYAERCGYFTIKSESSDYKVGIQPHPVTGSLTINHCILGSGGSEAEAIDGMFLSFEAYTEEGHSLPADIEAVRALVAEAAAA